MENYKWRIGDRVDSAYGYCTITGRQRDPFDDTDEYRLEPFNPFAHCRRYYWVSEYKITELLARWDWITSHTEGYVSGDKYIWDSRKRVWSRTDRHDKST